MPSRRFGVAAAILLAACSSNAARHQTTTATHLARAWRWPPCHVNSVSAPAVSPVPGVASDRTLTSFDGARIRVHWFPRAGRTPSPTVLMGPGWGSGGDTNAAPPSNGDAGLFGALRIATLRAAGYNVATWDPRGFGASTGTVEVDSPQFEARDVQRILDWLATLPEVQLDAAGDPRVGMVGGSYGGGIQLVTAATDCRVDAIVPTIAWHSLESSLYKAQTVKTGWGNLLYGVAASRNLDAHIRSSQQAGATTGVLNAPDKAWYLARGPGDLIQRVAIPTLFVQGTVDTLFTLDEAVTNYRTLRAHDVPTAMLWFCGGHGTCLTKAGDTTRAARATLDWLHRYLQQRSMAMPASRFEFVDQQGDSFVAPDYPLAGTAPIVGSGSGTLQLVATGGSGPSKAGSDALGGIVAAFTPARATNAVDVAITATHNALVVGAPKLTLTYSGTVAAGQRPTRVFAQLVDDTTGLVLGNQITPIEVVLDGASHTVTVPLEIVAFSAARGARLTLQIVATTTAYAQPRLGGTVTFAQVRVALPTVSGAERRV